MPKTISPLRCRAELFDKMQFFFQRYNDHQLHAVIELDGTLSWERLQNAVVLSFRQVPILGCRFVPDPARPYWEAAESARSDAAVFSDLGSADPAETIRQFITGRTNELTGPQIKVRLVRSGGRDTLCILMNHMVCDGAGFKEYLYLLGRLYTHPAEAPQCPPDGFKKRRSEEQLFRSFTFRQRLKILFRANEAAVANANMVRFPLDSPRGETPRILTHRLPPARFAGLLAYGKRHGVTVNDIVLAAYFRALNATLPREAAADLHVPCMVDLRRYLKGNRAAAICNLASMMPCHIGPTRGQSFEETVALVHRQTAARKADYPGLNGLAALRLVYRLPFRQACRVLERHYANPLIGITNIGIIDDKRLAFVDVPVADAFVAASIKHPPYFQLGFTTFRGAVTFTIGQFCGQNDANKIGEFLGRLDTELKSADETR